tara:strand:- start:3008 stop:3652 length:645 start_codon:yes stop_codon:yes gene_type:complete
MAETLTSGASAETARAVCVFLHGRGQTAVQMQEDVIARLDAPDVHFVLPQSKGSAWYDAKAVDPMTETAAVQLDAALALVQVAIASASEAVPGRPLVIAGFSQGACLGTEYLLRGGKADAAALLTGCRVGAPDADLPETPLGSIPVYLSNGDEDPWIPLWAWRKAEQALVRQGARVRSEIFSGRGHLVCDDEIDAFSGLLRAVAEGKDLLEYPK